uniref:hypothetical protein n=1 Tax=Thaumasiovibrio occultus TaxID=1891184 RepID=UPI000B34C29E|nr:hypothetical protein [Thaumasiovibrio occultus]
MKTNKKTTLGLAALFGLAISYYAMAEVNDIYAKSGVTIDDCVIEGNRVTITYTPMMETLYYSPGIEYQVMDERVILSVVRCPIKKECAVDSELIAQNGQQHVVSLTLDKTYHAGDLFVHYAGDDMTLEGEQHTEAEL